MKSFYYTLVDLKDDYAKIFQKCMYNLILTVDANNFQDDAKKLLMEALSLVQSTT